MIQKVEGVDIIIRDLSLNPSCPHGPTILFSQRNGKKYFSCAGIRNRDCFYLDFKNFVPDKVADYSYKARLEADVEGVSYSDVTKTPSDQQIYCKTCGIFLQSIATHESHNFKHGVDDNLLKEPSLFLPQLDNDKLNAQYFFDDNTLDFICSMFECLKLRKIICVGAPRLHDYIRTRKPQLKSILLDIDTRFKSFNQPEDFIQYNMINHHFFEGPVAEAKLVNFMKDDESIASQHCLFSDPPFAARPELLPATFRAISALFNRTNSRHKILPIFLVFPYFNEHHIKRQFPEMEMLDFQVSYMNHRAFRDDFKGRKAGSPVRIFTNVAPSLVKFPARFTSYRHCAPCHRFVAITNKHCNICKTCPSKNGTTYRHCHDCILCVKPNYIHCSTCNRCVIKMNHDCATFQSHQECWFCCQRGHVEKNCELMKKFKKRTGGTCVVCKGRKKHNLSRCKGKLKFIGKSSDL